MEKRGAAKKSSNIRRTVKGNIIVDNSDVAGASLQLHFQYLHNTWLKWIGKKKLRNEMRNI